MGASKRKSPDKPTVRFRPYLPRQAKDKDGPQTSTTADQEPASPPLSEETTDGTPDEDMSSSTDAVEDDQIPQPHQDRHQEDRHQEDRHQVDRHQEDNHQEDSHQEDSHQDLSICAWCVHAKQPEDFLQNSDVPHTCARCVQSICRQCITDYMKHQMDFNPEGYICFCGRKWQQQHVINIVGQTVMEKQLDRLTFMSLERSEYFRWCAADRCTSGQFYGEEVKANPRICCGECGTVNCFKCRHTFHEGLTCEEFQDRDLRKHRTLRDSKTQKAMRDDDARRCPHCGTAVERTTGCDAVYCLTCGRDFDFGTAARI